MARNIKSEGEEPEMFAKNENKSDNSLIKHEVKTECDINKASPIKSDYHGCKSILKIRNISSNKKDSNKSRAVKFAPFPSRRFITNMKLGRVNNPCFFTKKQAQNIIHECRNLSLGEDSKDEIPSVKEDLTHRGTKYVDQSQQLMSDVVSCDEVFYKGKAAKKIQRKRKVKTFDGKPLPDYCLESNWNWLYEDKDWVEKNRNPVLKLPASVKLSQYVAEGKKMTKEIVAEIESLAKMEVANAKKLRAATTTISIVPPISAASVVLLPGEVPINNMILRVEVVKSED